MKLTRRGFIGGSVALPVIEATVAEAAPQVMRAPRDSTVSEETRPVRETVQYSMKHDDFLMRLEIKFETRDGVERVFYDVPAPKSLGELVEARRAAKKVFDDALRQHGAGWGCVILLPNVRGCEDGAQFLARMDRERFRTH